MNKFEKQAILDVEHFKKDLKRLSEEEKSIKGIMLRRIKKKGDWHERAVLVLYS